MKQNNNEMLKRVQHDNKNKVRHFIIPNPVLNLIQDWFGISALILRFHEFFQGFFIGLERSRIEENKPDEFHLQVFF